MGRARGQGRALVSRWWGGVFGITGAALIALAGCADPGAAEDSEADLLEAGPLRQDGPAIPVPTLSWEPCGEAFPGIDCAVAKVPLDYDQPRGAETGIALARYAAADPADKIGTLFVNPGGPGGSGVDMVINGFGEYLWLLLQGKFDVVGFDPRGVASSEPLYCFDSEAALAAFFDGMLAFPYRPEQKRPYFQRLGALADQCLGGRPRIAPHMSTADVARDLDLLRQAVGDRRLSYLGFSYGSHIGNTYANLFPNKVRALVIDGVLDPKVWTSGRQAESDRVSAADELAEFFRLCDEASDDCPLAGPGGSAARHQALAAALYEHPLVFDETFSYGYDLLVSDTTSALYTPELWGGPEGYAALFAVLADAVLGDAEAGRQARAVRQSIRERLRQASPPHADYDNGLDSFFGSLCADVEFPRTFAEFRNVGARIEKGSFFGGLFWWQNVPCADWPVSPDRYTGPWSTRTSAPVLVVGNLFDGITGYDGAVASSKLLTNSRLLTYAGWGHTAFIRSSCATEHILSYLLDGALPPAGTVCPANPNPFLPQPAALLRAAGVGPVAGPDPMVGLPPSWPPTR